MDINPASWLSELSKYKYNIHIYLLSRVKNGVIMPRPSKLTNEIQPKIGDGVSLGLTYTLAGNSAGITYQTLIAVLGSGFYTLHPLMNLNRDHVE